MFIDMQIALDLEMQADPAMIDYLLEHVIEKAQTGVYV